MEVRLALDTNTYIDGTRGDKSITLLTENADAVYLPFVVIAELRYGFLRGHRGTLEEKLLGIFLAKPSVVVLMPDDATTRHYAMIRQQLSIAGKPIPSSDIWIAALVVQHSLTLCTRDQHFAALPQISRV